MVEAATVGGPGRAGSIFVDLSTTVTHRGRMTGIARVERELASVLLASGAGRVAVAWSPGNKRFRPIAAEGLASGMLEAEVRAWEQGAWSRSGARDRALPDDAVLLVAGKRWMDDSASVEGMVAATRGGCRRLIVLVHDLIPIRFPYLYEVDFAASFATHLAVLARCAAGLLVPSCCTRRDLLAWAAREGIDLPPIAVIRLGDILAAHPEPARLPGRPYVLAVGAVHTRKNHALLHAAWHLMHARDPAGVPDLVLIGGAIGDGHAVLRRIVEDDRIGRHVHVLTDVDDAALAALVDGALLVAHPAWYEGWGLPVAEALARGKIVLAAQGSATQEIHDLGVDLLSPHDPAAWATRILHYAADPRRRRRAEAKIRSRYRPTPWSDTAQASIAAIEQMPVRSGGVWPLGVPLNVAGVEALPLLRGPWGPVDARGRLARSEASIEFLLASYEPCEDLALEVTACAASAEMATVRVECGSGGVLQAAFAAEPTTARLLLPARSVAGGVVTLRFHGDEIRAASVRLIERRALVESTLPDTLFQPDLDVLRPGSADPRLGLVRGTELGPLGFGTDPQGVLAADLDLMPAHRNALPMRLCLAADTLPARVLMRVDGEPATLGTIMRRTGHVLDAVLLAERSVVRWPVRLELFATDLAGIRPAALRLVEVAVRRSDWWSRAAPAALPPPVRVGEHLSFGVEMPPPAGALLRFGWATAVGYGVEAVGSRSVLSFRPSAPARGLRLRCKLRDGDAAAGELEIRIDGTDRACLRPPCAAAADLNVDLAGTPLEADQPVDLEFVTTAPQRLVLRALQLLG